MDKKIESCWVATDTTCPNCDGPVVSDGTVLRCMDGAYENFDGAGCEGWSQRINS